MGRKKLTEEERFLREHPEFREPRNRRQPTERLGGQRVYGDQHYIGDGSARPVFPPSRTLEDRRLSVRMERLLERMKPDQADILRRVYYERATQQQIADDLGVSQQAVNQRVRTAERNLKLVIAEHGGDPDILEVDDGEL
jgi:RNA polymerase sigma factor (sigma-70 family)